MTRTFTCFLRSRVRRLAAVGSGCLIAAPLGGCIVWDIRDQLTMVNANMDEIEGQLRGVRADLDQVTSGLEPLDTLEPITGQLADIDKHLASLRETIRNIDSTIPFLKLSDDEDPDGAGAEGDAADMDADAETDAETGAETGAEAEAEAEAEPGT